MTLSPVFRSQDAVESLISRGHFEALGSSIVAEHEYERMLRDLLEGIIAPSYIGPVSEAGDDIEFLQKHFFLILFDSVYRSLGCPADRLTTYGLINLCLKGIIVSGDNLFDGEAKMDLPLNLGDGERFASIMQLLCFDHLVMRVLEAHASRFSGEKVLRFRREMLTCLASIGTLEGSEEKGLDEILPVETMIEHVHRVRGGRLFSLAFIAPFIREDTSDLDRWRTARKGIAHLGTAFQIVDDLTDFEFDLTRRSHNLLAAQITHHGSAQERTAFERMRSEGALRTGTVEATFGDSAGAVLELAQGEAELGFADLAAIGFWFPPDDASLFIRAIAGDAGEHRMRAITGSPVHEKV